MRTALYDEKPEGALDDTYPFHDSAFLSRESIFRCPPEVDLSVIVPCYNAEKYLPDCISSLSSQQHSCTLEVLLIDDGSRDGTGDLAEAAARADGMFRCIHQENQGAAAARNRGMREARGRYLLFVDADDVVSPEYVQSLWDCAQASAADISVCAYYSFTGDGRRYKTVQWGSTVSVADLNGTPWGKLFRRNLFEHLLWPSGYWYEDTVLAFLVYPRAVRIAATNRCTYGYRSSVQNATHTGRSSPKALDSFYITHLVLRAMQNAGLGDWLDSTEGRKRLLDQFYLNQCRIHRLPAECRKQVFRLQSAYVRQMQPCVQGDLRPDSPLYAMALRKNSAVLGQLAVLMEKPNKALKLFIRRAAGLFRRGEQGK